MLGFFKKLNARRNEIAEEAARLVLAENDAYCGMSSEELASLSDVELVNAAWARAERFASAYPTTKKAIDNMEVPRRTFYIVRYYENEVNFGGVFQYFTRGGRDMALFLGAALGEVGAREHQILLEAFLHDNHIATAELSAFATMDSKEFCRVEKKYPFDDFNTAFYALNPMTECLAAYIRENIGML